MFEGPGHNTPTGDYGWGIIMAPTFALIGAILGVLNYFLVSAFQMLRNRTANRLNPIVTSEDALNDAEWKNPTNWFGGIIYHSKLDTRILVPMRLSEFGHTINLGRPLWRLIAIVKASGGPK